MKALGVPDFGGVLSGLRYDRAVSGDSGSRGPGRRGVRDQGAAATSAVCGTAAVLVLTARSALELAAHELAEAAGCDERLVEDIESGGLDPALDTVDRLMNAVGLEVRAGAHGGPEAGCPEAGCTGVEAAEVERVRQAFRTASEFRRGLGLGPLGPPAGVQREWDGTEPAPPRLFGAGQTRRDAGGWAAMLVHGERQRTGLTPDELAQAAGLSPSGLVAIEDGRHRPPVGELQRILSAMDACLRVRLEPYEDHDDCLHLRALADPERHQRQLRAAQATFAPAPVVA